MANLEDDHGFISKEYISIGMRPFGETKSKAMRAYTLSGHPWKSVIPNNLFLYPHPIHYSHYVLEPIMLWKLGLCSLNWLR